MFQTYRFKKLWSDNTYTHMLDFCLPGQSVCDYHQLGQTPEVPIERSLNTAPTGCSTWQMPIPICNQQCQSTQDIVNLWSDKSCDKLDSHIHINCNAVKLLKQSYMNIQSGLKKWEHGMIVDGLNHLKLYLFLWFMMSLDITWSLDLMCVSCV